MRIKMFRYRDKHKIKNILITILGSVLYSIGISVFILPAGLYTGGFTGIAQLISDFTYSEFSLKLPVSLLWLLLNVPVFFIGFKYVGRRFTSLSIVSVVVGAFVLEILPVIDLTNNTGAIDRMLYAIMGGVVTGIGVGITLKVGSSTGGMDIISQYLSYKNERSIGQYSFILNGAIVLIAGATNVWDIAMYTIINLFISTLVIDRIHTRHHKLTLFIITEQREKLVTALHSRIYRGITIIPASGAYLKQNKDVLLMVISSYELYNIKAIIMEIDPRAFTDVLKSQHVFGNFHKLKVD